MKKINVGLASFGMSGKVFHAPLIAAHNGFQLKSVVERSQSEARNYYPNIHSVKTFDHLIEDDEIDLIVVNTPDHTHFPYTKLALEHGKHVIVEKPFTQAVLDGIQLIDLAKSKNKLLSIFQNRRWDGDFLTVQKIIKEGYLGRIVEYESHFDRFRNYVQPGTWKENASTGAGTLYNLGSHLIDQALVLFGMPQAIFADIRKLRSNTSIDDFFELILYYEKLRVTLKASYLVKEPGPRFTINGTQGSYIKYGIDPQEEALKKGIIPGIPGWGEEDKNQWGILHYENIDTSIRKSYETLPGNYMAYYNNIYDYLVNNKKLEVTPEDALNVIKVIETAFRSNTMGRIINLNPHHETMD